MNFPQAFAALFFAMGMAILLILILGSMPARSESWPYSEFSKPSTTPHSTAPRRYRKPRRRHRHGIHPATEVRAWRKLDRPDKRACKDVVEAVGTRRASNDRALDDAREHWHQIVTAKFGIMFADVDNARQIAASCVSVSRPGVLSAIAEIGTREKLQDRQCVLRARPCGPQVYE